MELAPQGEEKIAGIKNYLGGRTEFEDKTVPNKRRDVFSMFQWL
jgi:hypothetical protein